MTNQPEDSGKQVQFQLRWPRWLSQRAGVAAEAQALSIAAWLRQAAIEKLERDNREDR